MKKLLLLVSILICCSFFSEIYASHAMGSDLTFAYIGPNQYRITMQVYRDCNGVSLSGPMTINVNSAQCNISTTVDLNQVGGAADITPTCIANVDACHGGSGYGIQKYTFQGILTLPAGCGSDWVLSWDFCCRNAAITTLNGASNDGMYVEAHLNNTLPNGDSSPNFGNDPVGIYCLNSLQQFNHGAIDPEGDSLYFYLMTPLSAAGTPVTYNGGLSATNPMNTSGGTAINNQNGQLSFNPNQAQVCVIKVGCDEYRNGVMIGHIERDMQIIVANCNNNPPASSGINGPAGGGITSGQGTTLTVPACSDTCFTISTGDPNSPDSVFVNWIANGLPGARVSSSGGKHPVVTVCWAPTQADVGPNSFVLLLRDNACPFNGNASIAYTVMVTPSSNPPVSAGNDTTICTGRSVNLTAATTGIVSSYNWSDGSTTHSGATWTVSPASTTIYTVTAYYSNGCQKTDQVVVNIDAPNNVSAYPGMSTVCSTLDTIQLGTVLNGAVSAVWSPAAGLTCTTCINPKASPTVTTTYAVYGIDALGCHGPVYHVTVNMAPQSSCTEIYTTPGGNGNGTVNSPASLAAALSIAQCNNAVIKMSVGLYNIDSALTDIGNYATIEGGFDPANNWRKTSQPGATTIYRTTNNLAGSGQTKRLSAIEVSGKTNFRLQDVTIQTANCPPLLAGDNYGYSNYGIYLNNCSNYNIVRCQVVPGSGGVGGTGSTGSTGNSGNNGITTNNRNGAGAPSGPNAGGAGGTGGTANSVSSGNNGSNGSPGVGAGAGAGGAAGGGAGLCANSFVFGGTYAAPGGNGSTGSTGSTGTTGPSGSISGGFFAVGGTGGTGGTGGVGGGGGGGGGAGGSAGAPVYSGGGGGGSGGSGGGGGGGGGGGYGSGGSFGIFIFNNGVSGIIKDCNLTSSVAAPGGAGGNGGPGGSGGIGGGGNTTCGNCCNNNFGTGGNGGSGGTGGAGGAGAAGITTRVYISGGTALVTADSTFNLVGQPIIGASNISCTLKNDTFSAVSSANWNTGAGATVPSGTGSQLVTQYTNSGRKDITYSGNIYTGFANIILNQTTYLPSIQSSASVLNGDTFWLCQGSTAGFSLISAADTFDWDFGGAVSPNTYLGSNYQNISSLTFTTPGVFKIKVRLKTSCCGWSNYDSAYILVEQSATIGYTGFTSFCAGDSVNIVLSGTGSSHQWLPAAGVSDPTGTNVYVSPAVTTTYLVTSYSPRGLCNADTTIVITKITPPVLTFTSVPATCGSNGSVTVTPAPAGSYTYSWNPSGSTATLSSQPSGTYYVTVTPVGTTCATGGATSIAAGAGLQAYMIKTISPLCYGQCTGQVKVKAIGGTSPFSYQWAGNASTLDSLNNLCALTSYTVTISDQSGCTASATQYLSQPQQLSLAILDSVGVQCQGQCNGSALLDGLGGTGPYTFAWSGPAAASGNHPTTLCGGYYAIVVTDNNNCTAAGGVNIISQPAMALTFNNINDSCFGQCNGRSTASVTNGRAPYTFVWNNGTHGTRDSNLCVGQYILTVTDSFLCSVRDSTIITQPTVLTAQILSSINDSCFGQCNGRAVAGGSGGTPPYSIHWNNGTNGATDSNLCPAIYTATVTDANGCTATVKDTITQPAPLAVSLVSTNVTCHGACNGRVVSTPSGGTAPYTFIWTGGASGQADSNLCPGIYTLQVIDRNGCSVSKNDTITEPTILTIAVTASINVNCFGQCNGRATVLASGGSPIYSYHWNNGLNGATDSNLCAGIYSAVVTDSHGCTATVADTITQPTQLVADTLPITPVSCFGGSNGAMTLTVTGGVYPYTYTWVQIPGKTDSLGNTFAANTYVIYVGDAHNCKDTVRAAVTQPARLVPTVKLDSISCLGANDGRVILPTVGGTAPYTYDLDAAGTPQAADSFSNLSQGAHTVTVADAHGCDTIVSFTIFEPTAVAIQIVYTRNASCNTLCNGAIRVSGSGGTPPYRYSINHGAFSAVDSFTGLCAAMDSITIRDAHGCTQTIADSVSQPAPLILALDSSSRPLCFGDSSGQVFVSASGGTGPYTYSINSGAYQTSGTFIGLWATTHTLSVKDAANCISTLQVPLAQPAALQADTLRTQPVNCHGGSDGVIVLAVSGGTYPYTYQWQQVPGLIDSFGTTFAANTYTIFVTDSNSCHKTVVVTLIDPSRLLPSVTTITPVSCYGGNTGGVVIGASGGTPAYSYDLDSSGTFQASNTFGNLTGGPHSVTVRDAHGCDSTINFTVPQPTQLVATVILSLNATCNTQCNGEIRVSGSGGTGPYQYSIDGVNFQTADSFINLCAGPYVITIKDINNCTTTTPDTITQPTPLVIVPVDSVAPKCHNGPDGHFRISASGGVPGYSYSVDGNPYQTLDSFINQSVGTHTVTVKDSNLCITAYIITVPNTPVTSTYDTIPGGVVGATCFGSSNGSITLAVTGTTTPYTFQWSNNANTQNISGILGGTTYIVAVADGNNCPLDTNRYFVPQPLQLVRRYQVDFAHCFGDSNGCITAIILSGGTPPFTYSWSNGSTANPSCNFPIGLYSDTIRDNNGCTTIDTARMWQHDSIHISLNSLIPVSCNANNGVIAIAYTGGSPAYTLAWSNGNNVPINTNLAPGPYTLTITDGFGCKDSASYVVPALPPLVVNHSKQNVFCTPLKNGWIDLGVGGGNPGYTYLWSNGATTKNNIHLDTGSYSVIVTDTRGCTVYDTVSIINDSAFVMLAVPDTATINEGDQIQLGLNITGDRATSISWTPSGTLSCSNCSAPLAAPLHTTLYTIHAVSDSGCTADTKALITVLPQHQLYIPNAFTPNNDGNNDFWEAFGYKQAWLYVDVNVYDRWGELVFQSKDINFKWDATYLGEPVQPGVYTYTFKLVFIDDLNIANRGSITIIR